MLSSPPLSGVRVVELAGLAPAPFASLLLADYGASVLRIDRPPQASPPSAPDLLIRYKTSISLDLKRPLALALLESLLNHVDILIDPYRPGVLESLGLLPDKLLASNPRLIIARLTGFRRDGPYAHMAGHDINYLAASGVLSQLGRVDGPPSPPANILADFAGGGLMCALGIVMALLQRTQTGKGQVVENNMVDGTAYLGTFQRLLRKTPVWDRPRGSNLLDGGYPGYEVYECSCGGHMAVGALEPKFFRELVLGLGIDPMWVEKQHDRDAWPELKEVLMNAFRTQTRAHWEAIFLGKDACCTPVLSQEELEVQGYEQRLPFALKESPDAGIPKARGWSEEALEIGKNGERTLQAWMGWKRGRDYYIENRSFVKSEAAKM